MRVDLFNFEYQIESGKPVIYLFGRNMLRKRVVTTIHNFRPYFYYKTPLGAFKTIFGEPCEKKFVNIPSDVRIYREEYQHLEADIPFALRYLIDAQIYSSYSIKDDCIEPCEPINVEPKVLYWDIEVLSPPEIMPRVDSPDWPIVAITCVNNYDDEVYCALLTEETVNHARTFTDESQLIHDFTKYVDKADPDILTGWFICMSRKGSTYAGYDLPYLAARAKRLGVSLDLLSPMRSFVPVKRDSQISYKAKGRSFLDMLELYLKMFAERGKPVSMELKSIVTLETGFTYEDFGDRIEELHKSDLHTLRDYCVNDVLALKKLDRKLLLIQEFDRRRRICGAPIEWSTIASRLIDVHLLRTAKRQNVVLPSKPKLTEKKHQLRGGLVVEPPKGLISSVALIDTKAAYPSIILSFNISPETKQDGGNIELPNGKRVSFSQDKKGIIPQCVEVWANERAKLKQEKMKYDIGTEEYNYWHFYEKTFRYFVNAWYGVMAYSGFRLYDPDCSNAVTTICREITRTNAEQTDCIYADTDSVFVVVRDLDEATNVVQSLNSRISDWLRKFGAEVLVEVSLDSFFENIFFVEATKKHYSAWVKWEGKPCNYVKIVGFEARRSDSAEVTRVAQRKFLEILHRRGVERAIEYLRDVVKTFDRLPAKEIAIPKGLSRPLDTYQRYIYAKAVLVSMQKYKFKYFEDKRPKLLYIKNAEPRYIVITEAAPEDVEIDKEKMFDRTIKKPFAKLLESLNISWSCFLTGTKQTTLSEYVGEKE